MRLNILLNHELGLRIWSFPMRYQPVTLKERSHVGKHWTKYTLRSFQIMLQATHGVVSGSASFFEEAYGGDAQEFYWLLSMPHAFLYHRAHYKSGEGRAVLDEYLPDGSGCRSPKEEELGSLLAGPRNSLGISRKYYEELAEDSSRDTLIKEILRFHTLDTHHRVDHRGLGALPAFKQLNPDPVLPAEDEFIEDAGLFDEVGTEREGGQAGREAGGMGGK